METNVVAEMLREGLLVKAIGRRLLFYETLGSTMDEAARLAEDGIEEGATIIVERQTSGRGRFNRPWISTDGNLMLSIVLRPSLYSLRYLSILAGVATARAITKTTGLNPSIKWPNDVRIDGKKVGGILVESSLEGNAVRYTVVGIGINVKPDSAHTLELMTTATCLDAEIAHPISRQVLLRHILQEGDILYRELQQGSTPLDEWRSLLDTLGKMVTVRVMHGAPGSTMEARTYSGLAEGVDAAGNLVLRTKAGHRIALSAGEVTLQETIC